ncbi:hypothetical protein MASR2M79_16950 [Aminivibrio sp.]
MKQSEYVMPPGRWGSHFVTIMRYVLPNAISPIIIQTILRMATVLLTAAGLGFLGLGVQPPQPGNHAEHRPVYLRSAPSLRYFRGVSIMIVVLGFNF